MGQTNPYIAGSETSKDAAESMESSAESYEIMVLNFVRNSGTRGATADECQSALGLTHQNGSARVSMLARRGAIVRTDAKRKTRQGRGAFVYVAPEFAHSEDDVQMGMWT